MKQPSSQPNILLLFTDQQRADSIHALGNKIIQTPNMDRLVREGTAFTNCYSPSPVCVPARISMQYGLYPQKTHTYENFIMMNDNGNAWPAVLGRNGYQTRGIGKCHFDGLRGFDQRETQEELQYDPKIDDYVDWLDKNGYDTYEAHGARGEMYYIPQISSLPVEAHPTQWIGDRSIAFINEMASGTQPWGLFASFIHPHPPMAPPKPWHKLYRTKDMPLPFLPENSDSLHTWVNRVQNRYKYRDRGLDLNLVRTLIAYYYASISFIDFQIGRILDTLEKKGQLDNTLVLLTSDHGEHLGDLGCFGKRSMHDAASRVPMIARLPGCFAAGTRCTTATSLVDVFPTMLGAANIFDNGLDLDGVDLAKLTPSTEARVVYSQYEEKGNAIYMAVSRDFKYVYSAGDRMEFYFDRQSDPREVNNLAVSHPDHPGISAARDNLLTYLLKCGMSEVVSTSGQKLSWLAWLPRDESELADPDRHLILQDYAP
jgi:arylsulfatase